MRKTAIFLPSKPIARLYCQLVKEFETLPAYKETSELFAAHGNHVVHYSSHEWSGTWCDICIEQTLMKSVRLSCPLLPGSSWLQSVAPRLSVSNSDMLESSMSLQLTR